MNNNYIIKDIIYLFQQLESEFEVNGLQA